MQIFELTEWGFLIALWVFTALVFLLAVVFLPRLPTRRLISSVVQAVVMLLVSVLILVSVAAYLNRQNSWYTSWDDLAGGSATALPTEKYGAPAHGVTKALALSGSVTDEQRDPQKNPAFQNKIQDTAAHGQYFTVPVAGETSGQTYDVMVWLPKSYLHDKDKLYPVIMGFTGFPGSPQTYSHSLDYGHMIEQAVDEGKLRDSIFVVPAVLPGTYDTECVDGTREQPHHETPRVETYITKDLIPWVKQNLRVGDDPRAWAATGYSAGGYCSAMFSVKHPDLFGSGLVQSGYFEPECTKGQRWNESDDPRYDLQRIASTTKPSVNLNYYSSQDDPLSWPSLTKFRDHVAGPTSLSVDSVAAGGHRQDVWQPGMVKSLSWLGSTSPFFAPRPNHEEMTR
ncbi:esterase family protein [Rothia sp. p3-SID1597]|nr:esterase family protein [Rothia sp. p3-SID1597]